MKIQVYTLALLSLVTLSLSSVYAQDSLFDYDSKCLKAEHEKFSFNHYDPAKNGEYPRNGRTLYRSFPSTSELSLSTFMRGAMGDKTIFYSSYAHSYISRDIRKKLTPEEEIKLKNYVGYYADLGRYESLKKCIQALPSLQQEREAELLATDTLNDIFTNHQDKAVVPERYLDYRSKRNVDYFNQPKLKPIQVKEDEVMGRGEIIFTTNDRRMTDLYPREYLVSFKEQEARSIDLNYWNRMKYGSWIHHENDTDEYIAAGFYEARSIQSLYRRSMNLLAVKVIYKENVYVLFTTMNSESVKLMSDPHVRDIKYAMPVYGVVSACAQKDSCEKPLDLMKMFPEQPLDAAALTYIENELLEANRFARNGRLKFDLTVRDRRVSIVEAFYGTENVTKQVSEFCLNKTGCTYKFKHAYVFGKDIPVNFSGKASINYRCGKEDEILTVSVAEPAENKIADLKCD